METLFARINAFGDIENVIVATQEHIDGLPNASSHVQTFFDAGGDATKRYNFAEIGGRFDAVNNAFIAPEPYESWTLDDKFAWKAPKPMPVDGKIYRWDEAALSWVLA